MPRDYSPFTPGTPVGIELFAGRLDQIRDMERMIKQTLSGSLKLGFLRGERGMGKSSLANYIRELAENNHEQELLQYIKAVGRQEERAFYKIGIVCRTSFR